MFDDVPFASPPPFAAPFDRPVTFTFVPAGTAPYTAERATGLVTIAENGQELGRTTVTSNGRARSVTINMSSVGLHSVRADYAGDVNFLPITKTFDFRITPGSVTILAFAERHGEDATIHVRTTGSPAATPTGTISISIPGITPSPQATLVELIPGTAEADVTLTNVASGPLTLIINYSGDGHYHTQEQDVRLQERKRAGRH